MIKKRDRGKPDLPQQIAAVIGAKKLFRDGQKILVAVSGGLDSMALLALLDSLAAARGWQLTVAHFNHQLRGKAGDADERLVRKTAKSLGWPMVAGSGAGETTCAPARLVGGDGGPGIASYISGRRREKRRDSYSGPGPSRG